MWTSCMVLVHCARNRRTWPRDIFRCYEWFAALISTLRISFSWRWTTKQLLLQKKTLYRCSLHMKLCFLECRSLNRKHEEAKSSAIKSVKLFLFFTQYICLLNYVLDVSNRMPEQFQSNSWTRSSQNFAGHRHCSDHGLVDHVVQE